MEGWKQRLLKERNELREKESKLDRFIHSENFNKLDLKNQCWLNNQLMYMQKYLFVLEVRIRLNNIKEN